MNEFFDPVKLVLSGPRMIRFLRDWYTYRKITGAEQIRLLDVWPQVHSRTTTTLFDPHYFYANAWAFRRIAAEHPHEHVDLASQSNFVNLLSAVMPVTHVDYRPLPARLDGLYCVGADLTRLPFPDESLASISCLHVAEHIGLGRYGDPLDPQGTVKAAKEMVRVLSRGGSLYFALPIGTPRVAFNAHRIHNASTILEYFCGLSLREFSGVDDCGNFIEGVTTNRFDQNNYACGMFWFQKTE